MLLIMLWFDPRSSTTGTKLDELVSLLENMEQLWDEYLQRQTDDQISLVLEYESFDSGRCRSLIEDILAQLLGHLWYHRGQIASLVKAAGGQPAATDLIYWSWELVTETAS